MMMNDLHECIFNRRDTRHFTNEDVPDFVLEKAFNAAHAAPSVGLSEPWRFIVIQSPIVKKQIKNLFIESTLLAKDLIVDKETQSLYQSLKLEAIEESPIGVAVFCDHSVLNNFVLGTIGNTSTLEWSCACAIQNFWLSLTSQGYGAGWVSIMDYEKFCSILNVNKNWTALGYLCIGKPATNYDGQPMLQQLNWKKKSPNPVISYI